MRRLPLIAVHLAGIASFIWPFFWPATGGGAADARSSDAPWIMTLAAVLLIGLVVSELTRGGLSSRSIALLGVLTAISAMLRIPGSFAGAGLFFIVPLCAGFAYGPTFGFLLGSLGMAASALITGGVGPWLPFQLFAAGWVGAGAGLVGGLTRSVSGKKAEVIVLALTGAVAAVAYGLIINLYFWPVLTQGDAAISWRPGMGADAAIGSYIRFYALTSAWWDAVGAVSNAVLLSLAGGPALFLLRRSALRLSYSGFDVPLAKDFSRRSARSA